MAGAGMATATLILLLAAMVEAGSWLLLITGLGLAATSVRAAQRPNLLRLGAVGGNLLAIPLIALLI